MTIALLGMEIERLHKVLDLLMEKINVFEDKKATLEDENTNLSMMVES
jgi:FtsZ-binding cell division protein ZapB